MIAILSRELTLELLLLIAVACLSNGEDIYPDALESTAEKSFGIAEDDSLQDPVTTTSSFWHSPANIHLSPSFIDKTLEGNCTGTSAIACTGCRRIRVCIPGIRDQTMLPEVDCPSSTYCHTLAFDMGGACLATIDPQFPECRGTAGNGNNGESSDNGNNLCTGLGLFPDPSDCRRFYLCTAVGGYARKYKCPSNYVYNSQKKACSTNTRCRRIQCRPNFGSHFVRYPQDTKFYAYCNYERSGNHHTLNNILMYRCSAGSEFNELANGCVFKCPREGFFPKLGFPSRFYWCRKVRGNLFGYEQVCPWSGSTFNSNLRICIPPPLSMTTLMPASSSAEMTTATESSSTSFASSSTTTEAVTPTNPLADTSLQLPAWPQFVSLPVSSLL